MDKQLVKPGKHIVDSKDFGLPELIEIEPVHSCNLRCIMCHVSYDPLSKVQINVDTLKKRLRGMEGKWVVMGAQFEPMAHSRFAELMKVISSLDMKVHMTTNGTLLTPAAIESIRDIDWQSINISFDGIRKDTYEAIRRRANFDVTVERVLAFKEAISNKDPYFSVNYTVLKSNYNEALEAEQFWDKHGFKHLGYIPMVLRDPNEELNKLRIDDILDDVRVELDRAALDVIENNRVITVGSPTYNQSPIRKDHEDRFLGHIAFSKNPKAKTPYNPRAYYQLRHGEPFGLPADFCRSPFTFVRINYNGDVFLCSQYCVGNINEQDLIDIWYGEKAQQLRRRLYEQPKLCKTCGFYIHCLMGGKSDLSDGEEFISNKLSFRNPDTVDKFEGYNIVRWTDEWYGVPWSAGKLDIRMMDIESVRGVFKGSSLEEVRDLILNSPKAYFSTPCLIDKYKGFNIARYKECIYGVDSRMGKFSLRSRLKSLAPGVIVANSKADVIKRIDKQLRGGESFLRKLWWLGYLTVHPSDPIPGEEYKGYNFVRYKAWVFGIDIKLGSYNIVSLLRFLTPGVLIARNNDALKKKIDRRISPPKPISLSTYNGYNIISYDDWIYGIEQRLGPFNVRTRLKFLAPGIKRAKSEIEVRNKIDRQIDIGRSFFLKVWLFLYLTISSSDPILGEEYKGYNFVRYKAWVFAVDKKLGPYNTRLLLKYLKPGILVAINNDKLKDKIDGYVTPSKPTSVASYKGYNIVRYESRVFGIDVKLGSVDLRSNKKILQPGVIVARSVNSVKKKIDQKVSKVTSIPTQISKYKGHNLVLYKSRVYGIEIKMGPFNIRSSLRRLAPGVVSGRSEEAVKKKIDKRVVKGLSPLRKVWWMLYFKARPANSRSESHSAASK